jgi:hypothetical protein
MAGPESCPSPTPRPSPAAQLRDLVVVNEQSGVEWRVAAGSIDGGRIVIRSAVLSPPRNLFASRSATFTIRAVDGGDRARRFASVTLDYAATVPRQQYVFA